MGCHHVPQCLTRLEVVWQRWKREDVAIFAPESDLIKLIENDRLTVLKCGKTVTKAFVNNKPWCLVSISNLNASKGPIKCPFHFTPEKSAVAWAAVAENSEFEIRSKKENPTSFEALVKRDVDNNPNLTYPTLFNLTSNL